MVVKRIFIFILLFFTMLCSCTDNTQISSDLLGTLESSNDNNKQTPVDLSETPYYSLETNDNGLGESAYHITEHKYEYLEINIYYPQIYDAKTGMPADTINEIIKNDALSVFHWYEETDVNEGLLGLDIYYAVMEKTDDFISVVFEGTGNVKGAAHPNSLFYTSNIDLKSAKRVRLPYLYNANKQFVEIFFSQNNIYNKQQNSFIENVYHFNTMPDDWVSVVESADTFDINITEVFSYFTKDKVGISTITSQSLGGHIAFEVDKDLLKSCLKK